MMDGFSQAVPLTALPAPGGALASVLQPAPHPGPNPLSAPPTLVNGGMAGAYTGIPTQASMLQAVDKLKFFLATAPSHFDQSPYDLGDSVAREERCLNRFQLPTGELISCVLWNGLFHVTGTDIVRVLHFRFAAFGRPVRNPKKFEEGIFSDLRNLKSGTDATLEEPKSEFLELLFKYNCIRTQKKQKVFYWFSVPHDRLFLDALDRDLKREKLGVEPTTEAVAEPALSFVYNPNKSLYEQFTEQQALNEAEAAANGASSSDGDEDHHTRPTHSRQGSSASKRGRPPSLMIGGGEGEVSNAMQEPDGSQSLLVPPPAGNGYRSAAPSDISDSPANGGSSKNGPRTFSDPQANAIFGAIALFEGSPTYKQRRKPGQKKTSPLAGGNGQQRGQEDSSTVGHGGHQSVSPSMNGGLAGGNNDYDPVSRTTSSSSLTLPTLTAEPAPYFGQHSASLLDHVPAVALPQSMSPYVPNPGLSAASSAPPSATAMGGFHALEQSANGIAQPTVSAVELAAAAAAQVVTSEDGSGKSYVCPLFSCGRLFKRYEHLKRHLRIHTEEKPYACSKCDKRFARTDNLSAHLKIHEKMAARQGSTSSTDQRALEADEDTDDRHSPALTGYEASPQPSAFGYNMGFQPGLPTPPMGPAEQMQSQNAWSQSPFRLGSHPAGPALLTPDQSPDPSSFYGVTHRQSSLVNGAGAHDARRFRSATPNGTRGYSGEIEGPRHASVPTTGAFPDGLTAGGASSSSSSAGGEYTASPLAPGVSPLMSSFQQQLSMVNSLNAEMQAADAASLLLAPGSAYLHPSAAGFASSAENPGLGLLGHVSANVAGSMAPPAYPASSYAGAPMYGGDGGPFRSAADFRSF